MATIPSSIPATAAVETPNTPSPDKLKSLYKLWDQEIQDALKREKRYRNDAKRVINLYEARNAETNPFAILYSNTEVLQPAVYNARPIPFVDRRFKDEDPAGKAAAEVGTRLLKFLIDAESADYDNFDELMQPAVLDCLITNRGLTRFKYDAEADGTAECVFGEAVRWDKFFHGYARTWKKVPWIGFEWDMTKLELRQNFPDTAGQIDFSRIQMFDNNSEDKDTSGETREEKTGSKIFKVYEIWDKASRAVYFISPVFKDGPLKIVLDPLQLSGFFPVPKPLNFFRRVSTLVPSPLYIQYEAQAKELNDITSRLKAIIKAMKVRGFYNAAAEGIDKVLQADDLELTPVENLESLPDGSGHNMDGLIWLMPLAELSTTAQNLYNQREQVKAVIYEITGISDILRGSTVASETATAQNIKSQWGSLRLRKMQKEVQRYCRDCLRIMLEIGVTKFDPTTFPAMTGLQFPTAEQKQQVQAQMQQVMSGQQALPPPAGDPTQPPAQPPQIPPEIQQMLATPTWEDALGILRNDTTRAYRVDIETNSTIDAEASQDKQDISELLNALSQFLNGIAPLIEKQVLPFDVAKTMMLAIARRYTFGPQLEDALNKMQAPPPPDNQPSPADQAKLAGIQAQAQADQEKAKLEIQKTQQEAAISAQEHGQKLQMMEAEAQLKRDELALKTRTIAIQARAAELKLEHTEAAHAQKLRQLAERQNSQGGE